MTEPEVKAKILEGLYIHFETKEDALLFAASMGDWPRFRKTFLQLTGETARPKHWRELKTPEAQLRCIDMMERTRLSNGQQLLQAVKSGVVR